MDMIISGALAAIIIAAYGMKTPRGEHADWASWLVGLLAGVILGAGGVFLMLNGIDVVYQIVTALMATVGIGTTVVRLRAGFVSPT